MEKLFALIALTLDPQPDYFAYIPTNVMMTTLEDCQEKAQGLVSWMYQVSPDKIHQASCRAIIIPTESDSIAVHTGMFSLR